MRTWLRKVRGALGIGSIWGAAGAVLGGFFGGLAGVVGGALGSGAMVGAASVGLGAFLMGTGFGVVLSIMEGRKTLDQLSTTRAGVWGAVVGAGLALAGTTVLFATVGLPPGLPVIALIPFAIKQAATYGLAAGAMAAGTLHLAKREPIELAARATREADLLSSGRE